MCEGMKLQWNFLKGTGDGVLNRNFFCRVTGECAHGTTQKLTELVTYSGDDR